MKTIGNISWHDLTCENAEEIKDFYCQVMGWKAEAFDMGEYSDYNIINPNTNQVVAGICHKRGVNAHIPSQWMNYILVEDVCVSAKKCEELGGKIIGGIRQYENTKFCIIEDPAGSFMAIMSKHPEKEQ